MAKVEKGQFVALGLDEFKHELPQIARILMIEEDVMTIEWWVGTYSGTWNPWTVKSVEQTAIVHRNCIVLGNVTLSKTNRLAKHIVERLKTMKILSLCRLHYMYVYIYYVYCVKFNILPSSITHFEQTGCIKYQLL